MDIVAELLVAVGAVAIVLHLSRRSGGGSRKTSPSAKAASLATMRPTARRAKTASDPVRAIGIGGSGALDHRRDHGPPPVPTNSATTRMMDAMSGPGVCTPRS